MFNRCHEEFFFTDRLKKKEKKVINYNVPFSFFILTCLLFSSIVIRPLIFSLLSTFNPTPKFPFNGGGQFNNLGGDGFSSHFEAHWKPPSYSLRHYTVYKKPRCVYILGISSNTELDSLGSSDIAI